MLLGGIKASLKHQQLFEGTSGSIYAAVAPEDGDIVITKSRVNAFAGTDLELVLRATDINTLVLFGIATSGVVLSTTLHAADADLPTLHHQRLLRRPRRYGALMLMDKVFPRHATRALVGRVSELLAHGRAKQPCAIANDNRRRTKPPTIVRNQSKPPTLIRFYFCDHSHPLM